MEPVVRDDVSLPPVQSLERLSYATVQQAQHRLETPKKMKVKRQKQKDKNMDTTKKMLLLANGAEQNLGLTMSRGIFNRIEDWLETLPEGQVNSMQQLISSPAIFETSASRGIQPQDEEMNLELVSLVCQHLPLIHIIVPLLQH
ncbi:uncharacterized protein LOC128237310 [Mya arenaria]|uniref:uncharacterized protein LOC128237310 n=1 Tax=Mya arenaria TaxID=6604 RepID=UPI0022E0908D|nr:uncharacterized protein LOC128237310 [Mya arenaria]XP_052808669.1 uncharacterized protein LOC128237310 [Mya arenaria]